jgi:tetratricopeptide (TPR) repeat protein/TolB-like protein
MISITPPQLPPGLTPELVRHQLQKILESRCFASAETLRKLLEHLVTKYLSGEAAKLSESAIKVSLYSQRSVFETINVRSQATRLRKQLFIYYHGAGLGDDIEITIPTGGYVPRIGLNSAHCDFGLPVRLAVLPFVTLLPNGMDSSFGTVVAQLLMSFLHSTPSLEVVGELSCFRFDEASPDVATVGKQLDAAWIVHGVVSVLDGKRIAAVNLSGRDGRLRWSRRFECEGEDMGVVAEIARCVSAELHLPIPPKRPSRTLPAALASLHCKGLRLWATRTPDAVRGAVACFEEVIRLAPDYAPAYAAMANCHAFSVILGRRPAEARACALAAARKALEVDAEEPEALAAMGAVLGILEHRWDDAEKQLKKALKLDPRCATASGWYSSQLAAQGRVAEALEQTRALVSHDPLSIFLNVHTAKLLCFVRNYNEAVSLLTELASTAPGIYLIHQQLGIAYAALGEQGRAIESLERAAALSGRQDSFVLGALGNAYAVSGRPDSAQQILSELESRSSGQYVPRTPIAAIWAGLGETEAAFRELGRAREDNDFFLLMLAVWSVFEPLRADPRFGQLAAAIGLPVRG